MHRTIPATALPQLQLSDAGEQTLRALAAQLERELVSQFESFAFQCDRQVDDQRWKHTRADHDLHVYRECKTALRRDRDALLVDQHHFSKHGTSWSNKEHLPQATFAAESLLPRVLVTGLREGRLDDFMYGSTYQDTSSLQAFWDSQNDAMETSAVLAKVEGASLDDPYRFLGVTWALRTYPVAVLHDRDCLLLSDIRLATLSNGERVGISVAHSIQHRDLAELREFGTVRATSSLLQLFRQHDIHRVEVFALHFLDIKGHAMESVHLQQSIGYVLPASGYASDYGFHKKLNWLLSNRQRERQRSRGRSSSVIEPQWSGSADNCELCSKSLVRLFVSSGTTCQLCYKRICSRCSVMHDLPTTLPNAKTKTHHVDFCIECILQAKSMCALTIAKEELTATLATKRHLSTSSAVEFRREELLTIRTSRPSHHHKMAPVVKEELPTIAASREILNSPASPIALKCLQSTTERGKIRAVYL